MLEIDPYSKAALAAAVDIIKASVVPVIQDFIGYWGGDHLHDARERARSKIHKLAEEDLRNRLGPDEKGTASPQTVMAIVTAAQDETDDNLLELWARLLAASADPKCQLQVRHDYIDTIKNLSPIDALILADYGQKHDSDGRDRLLQMASRLKVSSDTIAVSLDHLGTLGLVANPNSPGSPPGPNAYATARARELLRVLFGSSDRKLPS